MHPMYTNGLPGRDWDVLAATLDKRTIAEIEKDLFALIRYDNACAERQTDTLLYESWLFKPGVFLLDEEKSDDAQRRLDKLKASGSWFLQTAAAFSLTVRLELLQITLAAVYEASGSDKKRQEVTFADQLRRAGARSAKDAQENEFLRDLATIIERKLGDECLGDMTPYYWQDERMGAGEMQKTGRQSKREAEEATRRNRRVAGVCQHCGGGFKGLFSRTCTSCGKKKDY